MYVCMYVGRRVGLRATCKSSFMAVVVFHITQILSFKNFMSNNNYNDKISELVLLHVSRTCKHC